MKLKKLLVLGMSALVLTGTAFSSFAAPSVTVYKGEDSWQRITIPLDDGVNYANIAKISFNTKDGARPSYVMNSHSITLKNLYHPGVDGKEVITVTMEDGSEWTKEIVYGLGGVDALGHESVSVDKLIPALSGQSYFLSLNKDADSTISEVYLDDVLLPRSAWTQSDTKLSVSQSYLLGVMGGTHTFYTVAAQGDMKTVERDVVATSFSQYPKISTQAVITAADSTSDISVAYNAGDQKADGQYNRGIDEVRVGDVTLDTADYTEKSDSFIIKPSGIAKMKSGVNMLNITYTDSPLLKQYTVVGCVVVKPAMDPAPELQPATVNYERSHPKEVSFTLTENGHNVTGFKVNGAAVGADTFNIDGTSVKVNAEWLKTLEEGSYKLSIQTDAGKDFPSSTIAVTIGIPDKEPTATPDKAIFRIEKPEDVEFTVDMGTREFAGVKVDGELVDTLTVGADGKLVLSKDYLATLAEGVHKISIVVKGAADADVAQVAVASIPLVEPEFGEFQDASLGLSVPWGFSANMHEYTFDKLKIDGNEVEAQYDDENTFITVAAKDFNAIGEKENVPVVVVTKEGKEFQLTTVSPLFVTNGMTVSINPDKNTYEYLAGSTEGIYIGADKDWTHMKCTGRSADGRTGYTGFAENVPDKVLPTDKWSALKAGDEITLVIYNPVGNIQSTLINIKVVDQLSEPEPPKTHPISPDKVTYDKRDKGDIEFTCDAEVKSYVISGTVNDKEVLRSGTCTTSVLPEAVLQALENGIYKVKFMGTDDLETDEITLVVTRSGAQDSSSDRDTTDWSYPGKTLPNRRNALGGGQTSGGSRGGGSSSGGPAGSGSTSSGSTTVTCPTIDINTLTLLTTTHAGWEKQADGRWKFKDVTGQYRANTYLATQSGYYVLGADGYMVTGWIKNSQGQFIYADPVNGNITDGWQLVNGVYYYMAKQDDATHTWGIMYANETTPDGYKVDASGAWIQ